MDNMYGYRFTNSPVYSQCLNCVVGEVNKERIRRKSHIKDVLLPSAEYKQDQRFDYENSQVENLVIKNDLL